MNTNNYKMNPEILIDAMQGERNTIYFYEKLSEMTNDIENIEIIEHAHDDEVKHFKMFANLYKKLYCKEIPCFSPNNVNIVSFTTGVKQSIIDELDAYEMYRNIYLYNFNPFIRNIFFEALTDENEHAAKFNYIFTKIIENQMQNVF